MRIILKNFRCYVDKEYNIPDSGLVLLSAEIGKGKTTIIKAILYCLYGSKAVKKPCTFGTNSSCVTIHYMGMKIKRTYRPKRVVVNDKYEDAVAQEMIDQEFGSFDDFSLVSYVPQKNNKSILSLAQTEQLRVIEAIAFRGSDNYARKEHLKKMIRDSSTELTKVQTELDFVKNEIDAQTKDVTPIELDIPMDGMTIDDAISYYKEEVENFNDVLEEKLDHKNSLTTDIHKYNNLQADHKRCITALESIQKSIAEYKQQCKNIKHDLVDDPEELASIIDNLKAQINYLELDSRYNSLQEEYDHAQSTEKATRTAKISEISRTLWIKEDRENCDNLLKKYKRQLDRATTNKKLLTEFEKLKTVLDIKAKTPEKLDTKFNLKLSSLNDSLSEQSSSRESLLITLEKAKIAQDIIHCPDCDAALRLVEGNLVSVNDVSDKHLSIDQLSTDISVIEKNIRKIKKQLDTLHQYQTNINNIMNLDIDSASIDVDNIKGVIYNLEKYLETNNRAEHELELLKDTSDSTIIVRMRGKLKDLKKELLKASTLVDKPTQSIEVMNKKLLQTTVKLDNYLKHQKELVTINDKINVLTKKGDKITADQERTIAQMNDYDIAQLNIDQQHCSSEIKSIRQEYKINKEICSLISSYEQYKLVEKVIEKWQKKYDKIVKKHQTAEKVHAANLTLKDKYAQAEILALEQTLEIINSHTNHYLEKMFDNGNIEAYLEIVNVGKKTTNYKIVTSIIFNGDHYDSINELSGGEFDLCTLASICGMNTMQNSPLLILDESLSSLDSDMNTDTFNLLASVAEDKLVLVCSHEAVRGIFDDIIIVQKDYC